MIKVFGPYKGIAIGKNKNGKYQAVLRLALLDQKGAYKGLSDEELKKGFNISADRKIEYTISNDRIIKKKDGMKSKIWKATITAQKYGQYKLSISREGEDTVQYTLHFPPQVSKVQEKVLDIFLRMINKIYSISFKKIRELIKKDFDIERLYKPEGGESLKDNNRALIKAINQLGLYNAVIDLLRKKYPRAWKTSVEKLAFYLTKDQLKFYKELENE